MCNSLSLCYTYITRMRPSEKVDCKLSRQRPVITHIQQIAKTNWLSLEQLHYTNSAGEPKTWDRFRRTTRTCLTGADGATILAITTSSDKEHIPHILLVKQYRPALDKFTIEFPSGLVDEGEVPEVAAIRELREETGYNGSVVSCSPLLTQSVLGEETLQLVTVKVNVDAETNQNVHPAADEEIEVLKIPFETFFDQLKYLSNEDCVIFEDVYCFAMGLKLSAISPFSMLSTV